MVVGMDEQRRIGLARDMSRPHALKINIEHNIAVENYELIVEMLVGLAQCPRGAAGLCFLAVFNRHAPGRSVATRRADVARPMLEQQQRLREPMTGYEIKLPVEQRLSRNVNKRLWRVAHEGRKARSSPAR